MSVGPLSAVARDNTQPAEARWRAAMILGELGDRQAAQTLIELCGDASHDTRQSAIWALGWLRYSDAFERLLRVVIDAHEEEQVRFIAASSLVYINTVRAQRLLMDMSRNAPDGVRRAARAALANLTEREMTRKASRDE
jgi:HEAT repeat protein